MTETIDTDVPHHQTPEATSCLGFLLLHAPCYSLDMRADLRRGLGRLSRPSADISVLALALWRIATLLRRLLGRAHQARPRPRHLPRASSRSGTAKTSSATPRSAAARKPHPPLRPKIVRAVGKMLIAMAIGAFVGYGGAALANVLLR